MPEPASRGVVTRILGLDIGDKRIGVALSDQGGIIASPLTIIERTDDDQAIRSLGELIRENDVEKIIAGLPVTMNGEIGHQASKVKAFVDSLLSSITIDLEYRDESLSTLSAKKVMRVNRRKKQRQTEHDDAVAAAFILQGYIDETYDLISDSDE